jgi:uncharacterized protein YdhG (YjbR/CyaY superfamily)
MNTEFTSVDAYIASFPEEVQSILKKIRVIVLENAPGCTEGIAYAMPSYKMNKKPLVYFAAFKKHIGFYATPTGHEAFKAELSTFKQGKGSVQFPLNQDMPYALITKIVKFRVKEVC